MISGALVLGVLGAFGTACGTEGEDGLPGKMGDPGAMGEPGPVGPPGPSTNAPAGAIMFFDSNCPTGWSEYLPLRGRVPVGATTSVGTTVGAQLADQGTRTINQVPAHTHTVDPPNAASTVAGAHTHDTDPGPFASTTDGSHAHTYSLGQGDNQLDSQFRAFYARSNQLISNNTGLPANGTSASAGSHAHTIDVPNTTSSTAGLHQHNVDIGQFDSGTTGAASVDVTMPYMQLRACRKD